ncbi:hypothetical protein [Desulfovibrio sp. JC022]|uniref:hypothetical protein n=1 Tax=Desulfovibrio sp. JC022 TaxID=2593642 RepID=UPI0013D4BF82|nr:hypothetical protein [Desulfovibrio sp. JC022]NDV23042.1 hypothetical protein [Desulfovibrio sp. JC022]
MISRKQIFESAFPFHILLDHDLKITSIGKSLLKLGYEFENTTVLNDLFQIKTPPTELNFEKIVEQSSTTFILEAHDGNLMLKGQVLEVGYHGKTELLFSDHLSYGI